MYATISTLLKYKINFMIKTKQLVPFQKKVSALASQVASLEIVDATSMQTGVVILSNMNKYMDDVKEKKETLTKPINTALKNIRAMFKPLEETYQGAIEMLRSKMSTYQTAEVARVREEEAKIAARVKEGKGNLSIDTAVKKMEAIATPEKEVSTLAGLVQFRESKILKVLDINLIPKEYFNLDEARLLKDLKAGIQVAGATTETIQVPVNYR